MSLQDLRIAFRRLRRAPTVSLLAIGMLSLALGAVLSVYCVVKALFLDALPVSDPSSLVAVYQSRDGAGYFPMSFRDFEDVRDQSSVLVDVAAHYPSAPLSLGDGEGGRQEIGGSVVTANYFSLLGVRPATGRFFRADENEAPGRRAVVVISHRLHQTRFGGEDPLGRMLELNGVVFEIIGVAPPDFAGVTLSFPSDVWIPSQMAKVGYRWCDPFSRDCSYLVLAARLRPGRTLEDLHGELGLVGASIDRARADTDTKIGLQAAPLDGLHPASRATVELQLTLLGLVAGLVLLVAATNLAGLLVGRGILRRGEVATRMALGADRSRVVSLFVGEAALLAVAGLGGGIVVARLLLPLAAHFHPGGQAVPWTFDGRFLAFGLAVALLAGVAAGLGSGWSASRAEWMTKRSRDQRSSGLGLLAAAQVAVTVFLLIGTGLLLRSLTSFDGVADVDAEQLVTLRSRPRLVGMEPQRAQAFHREVVRRLEARPDVESVALSRGLPPFRFFSPIEVRPGRIASDDVGGVESYFDLVSPEVFESLGMAIRRGRGFDERDGLGAPKVAVINRDLAARLFGSESRAIGESVQVEEDAFEVVGVVEDRSFSHAHEEPLARVYLAYWQTPTLTDARVTVRFTTPPPPGGLAKRLDELRGELYALDPTVPVTEVGTLAQRLQREFGSVYAAARLLTASGVVTLVLASAGIYSLLALWVGSRIREIGIRRALGGHSRHIVGALARSAGPWLVPAVAIGTLSAWVASPHLATYLYGVAPRDPLVFVAMPLLVAVVVVVAAGSPARRACRIEPMVALRED